MCAVASPQRSRALTRRSRHTNLFVCTRDERVAKALQRQEEVRIDAEFSPRLDELKNKQAERVTKRLGKMSDEVLKSLADHWVRQVLETDEHYRELDSEEEFEEKGCTMIEQRAELGRMLAMRRSDKILPVMHSFIHLCGLEVDMSAEESKRADGVFLTAVCTALDYQIQRQRGDVVQTDKVAPAAAAPQEVVAAKAASEAQKIGWDAAFTTWRDYMQTLYWADSRARAFLTLRLRGNQINEICCIWKCARP